MSIRTAAFTNPLSIHYVKFRRRILARARCIASAAPSTYKALSVLRAAPTSAYVHLPFCVQRCAYCAFTVTVSQKRSTHDRYLDNLEREIRAHVLRRNAQQIVPPPLHTIYLGGGTPSLLDGEHISRVLRAVDALGVAPNAEVTAEMDPATFDLVKAISFRKAGVNRVSLGAQTTHDDVLASCGRVHRRADVFHALGVLREARFDNISVDLMSGLPGLSVAMFQQSLMELLDCGVQHFSVYDLQLEPGTAFGKRYRSGVAPLPREDDAVRMLEITSEMLKCAGYERYEVSNYALPGFRSRHNMVYWTARPFYAFGVGATSLSDGFRFARPKIMSSFEEYVDTLQLNNTNDAIVYPDANLCSYQEVLEDYLINRFRLLVDGVPLNELTDLFGAPIADRLLDSVTAACFVRSGLIQVSECSRHGRHVRLTEKGAIIENSVLATILQDLVWNTQGGTDMEINCENNK